MKYGLVMVSLFVAAVLIQAFLPAWKKKVVTIMLSDDDLLAIFAPNVRYSPVSYLKELKSLTGIDHPLSEVTEHLERLVASGKIKKESVPVELLPRYPREQDMYVPRQVMYFV